MSTLKATYLQHPSAGSPNITLASTGAVALNGTVTGGGMDLITTQTFSAVSSVPISNCFTSTYSNYLVRINLTAGSGGLAFRLRAAGSDNTANSYVAQRMIASSTSISGDLTTATSFGITGTYPQMIDLITIDPAAAAYTFFLGTMSAGTQAIITTGQHQVSSAFDGIDIYATSMTGSVRVYGYKN